MPPVGQVRCASAQRVERLEALLRGEPVESEPDGDLDVTTQARSLTSDLGAVKHVEDDACLGEVAGVALVELPLGWMSGSYRRAGSTCMKQRGLSSGVLQQRRQRMPAFTSRRSSASREAVGMKSVGVVMVPFLSVPGFSARTP